MKKKFEILKGLPSYGEMYISIPENGYSEFSEGLAIKFFKNDTTAWIGNFETGSSSLKFATELKNSENILIIAGGICYIMNSEETKPKVEFGRDYQKVIEYKDKLILIGGYSFTIIENTDRIEHFDNLSNDGIKNVTLENDNLIGVLLNYNSLTGSYDESDYALNLETIKFSESKVIKAQNETENKKEGNKKWWQLW